ncbi:ABC transporter ATP-binding protein [Microvirga antarctica]|uniref:ABC transporter ATP-binding protein n=1 Tax=Microvirga antarctica TaxID=2819233 RepID=UPI001B310787|nr:ABC transporter ATP-binding protein [Microvirga antarctica]
MPILEVSGIGKRYGGIVAVEDVSFKVKRGIATGLIGPNGAGKTTVFDMLTGMQRADRGSIRFEGQTITNLASHKISRLGIGRTFQSVRVFGNLSVLENLNIAEANSAAPARHGATDRVHRALALVEMEEHAGKPAGALSYGQRKLVELAMVLVQEPRLIMLDEPVAGVNPGLVERLSDILRRLIDSGISLLLVEHNIRFVTGLCDHIVVLAAARMLADGTPEEIMRNPDVLEAFLGSDH